MASILLNKYDKRAAVRISTVFGHIHDFVSKGTMQRYFFNIYLTTFLEVCNFGNTLAVSLTFFFFESIQNLI